MPYLYCKKSRRASCCTAALCFGKRDDLECAPLTGCGTQHPHRALGGTRVLLAAAPTTPPCFRRWRRSSSLHFAHNQQNRYFKFRSSGTPASVPLLLFHRRGRDGKTAGAAPLSAKARGCGYSRQSPHKTKKPSLLHFCINDGFVLERPTRLELATSTLARWRSTR